MTAEINLYPIVEPEQTPQEELHTGRPELTLVPQIETNPLGVWAEENPEQAARIEHALRSDEELAGIINMVTLNPELRALVMPHFMTAIADVLMPSESKSAPVTPQEPVREAVIEEQLAPAASETSRWELIRAKLIKSYVELDAGLDEEFVADDSRGRSWGKETMETLQWEVDRNPRQRLAFANRPELAVVLTSPTKFEDYLNSSKTFNTVMEQAYRRTESPRAVLAEQGQKLSDFLDDPQRWQELPVEVAAAVANNVIAGMGKLKEYDQKLFAAVCSLIASLEIPANYRKYRACEDQITDRIAETVVTSIAEYDYQGAFDAARAKVKPESRPFKATVAAGAAAGWMLLTLSGMEQPVSSPETNAKAEATIESSGATQSNIAVKTAPKPFQPTSIELLTLTDK